MKHTLALVLMVFGSFGLVAEDKKFYRSDLYGTAWLFESDESKDIVLFGPGGMFTFQIVDCGGCSVEGMILDADQLDSEKKHTWDFNQETQRLIMSYSGDFLRMSLQHDNSGKKLYGTGVNAKGVLVKQSATRLFPE